LVDRASATSMGPVDARVVSTAGPRPSRGGQQRREQRHGAPGSRSCSAFPQALATNRTCVRLCCKYWPAEDRPGVAGALEHRAPGGFVRTGSGHRHKSYLSHGVGALTGGRLVVRSMSRRWSPNPLEPGDRPHYSKFSWPNDRPLWTVTEQHLVSVQRQPRSVTRLESHGDRPRQTAQINGGHR
jgi:hypothetical protein